ncbi:MAG: lactate utilization protein C [Bryobacteraceae bacterium]
MSSASSRTAILNRIKVGLNATEDNRAELCAAEWQELPRHYRRFGQLEEPELIALFDSRLQHYNGTPFYSEGTVREDIARVLAQRGKRVLIVPPAFPHEWRPSGFMFVPDENLTKEQLDLNDGVVTTCALGIALTGTVVLESSREQGRRAATLIPDYHLCVLRREDIVHFVPEAIRKLEASKDLPLTFFSGPSATVDIEMTRVRGVHGPRTLDVLIV